MNIGNRHKTSNLGLTLLEMTIVILVLLSLIGLAFMSGKGVDEWKLGRDASETLRQVHTAQRMFLADNPTKAVNTIEAADIVPYMPGNVTVLPTVKSLTGDAPLSIKVDVSPPFIDDGSGVAYDPTGAGDGVWDLGD
jgi:type II secretory pathway pseudopilin PulG